MKTIAKKIAVLTYVFALSLTTVFISHSANAALTPEDIVFKSALADKANLLTLQNAVNEAKYASLLERSKAIDNLNISAAIVKADIADFAARIKANGEVTLFNTKALGLANKFGGRLMVNEINSAGGAYNMLVKSGAMIDQELKLLKSDLSLASYLPSITELLGISEANAGILSTACGAFWFTISLGYADRFAYVSCYR
jgi:hypothetical protein